MKNKETAKVVDEVKKRTASLPEARRIWTRLILKKGEPESKLAGT